MAFSRLIEAIEQGTGKFDLNRTYYINNSSEEDIVVTWGAKEPEARGSGTYLIKAGEMGGPYAQFLAYHIVKALVSREMQKDGKAKFFGSAEMRAPYEDKYLKEVTGEQENPMITAIREQERAKLVAEIAASKEAEQSKRLAIETFFKNSKEVNLIPLAEEAAPEAPKRGRPKKEAAE